MQNILQDIIDHIPELLLCAGVAFVWTMVRGTRASLAISLVVSSAVAIALFCVVWFFRDGMGPDAVTSSGIEALQSVLLPALLLLMGWSVINGLGYLRHKERGSGAA
jgi:low affinity Fe/Cu permease